MRGACKQVPLKTAEAGSTIVGTMLTRELERAFRELLSSGAQGREESEELRSRVPELATRLAMVSSDLKCSAESFMFWSEKDRESRHAWWLRIIPQNGEGKPEVRVQLRHLGEDGEWATSTWSEHVYMLIGNGRPVPAGYYLGIADALPQAFDQMCSKVQTRNLDIRKALDRVNRTLKDINRATPKGKNGDRHRQTRWLCARLQDRPGVDARGARERHHAILPGPRSPSLWGVSRGGQLNREASSRAG